jgi:hypothetical protein
VVSWYSTANIQALFASARANTTSDLDFIICDNTNGKDAELYDSLGNEYRIISFSPEVPAVYRRKRRYGSYAHGAALNMLLHQINTEYCLFADPDCLILASRWDRICRQAVSAPSIAFGAPYHSGKIPKYHNFPSPVFSFFRAEEFRKIGADWTPYKVPLWVEAQDQLRRVLAIAGSVLGQRVAGEGFFLSWTAGIMRQCLGNSGKDTGWRIAAQARRQRYQANLLTTALVSTQLHPLYAMQPSVQELMSRFELFLWQGIPFVTHYYGSPYRKHGNINQAIEKWRGLAQTVGALYAQDRTLNR